MTGMAFVYQLWRWWLSFATKKSSGLQSGVGQTAPERPGSQRARTARTPEVRHCTPSSSKDYEQLQRMHGLYTQIMRVTPLKRWHGRNKGQLVSIVDPHDGTSEDENFQAFEEHRGPGHIDGNLQC